MRSSRSALFHWLILSAIYLKFSNALNNMEPDTAFLLGQIDSLGKTLSGDPEQDCTTRKQLRIAARNLTRALEEPGDVIERICWQVWKESLPDLIPKHL